MDRRNPNRPPDENQGTPAKEAPTTPPGGAPTTPAGRAPATPAGGAPATPAGGVPATPAGGTAATPGKGATATPGGQTTQPGGVADKRGRRGANKQAEETATTPKEGGLTRRGRKLAQEGAITPGGDATSAVRKKKGRRERKGDDAQAPEAENSPSNESAEKVSKPYETQGPQNFGKRILNAFLCASNDPEMPKKSCPTKCLDCLKPSSDEPAPEAPDRPARETWGNRCTFFVTTLGMSVGLGQVWRFPTLAYREGGGAFLVMYSLMIFFFGNTLFFFEISNGQYTGKSPLKVYDKVPLFQGVGWCMIAYAYMFCTYYSHMVAFSFYYFFNSFSSQLPWTKCPEEGDFYDSYSCFPLPKYRNPNFDGIICGSKPLTYNKTRLCIDKAYAKAQQKSCCDSGEVSDQNCGAYFNIKELCSEREYPSEYFWTHTVNRVYRKDDPMNGYIGPLNYWLTLCSFLTWFLAYFVLYKGIKSLGFLMYIMVFLPYIILIVMFGVVVFQDGAVDGLKEFFMPQLQSFVDVSVWRLAAEQAFYSIGVAMGPLITFGSYSNFNSPSHIDGTLICLCIVLTSVLCSLVVFSVLGFLSHKSGKPFHEVVEAGPGLVFIVYPESLQLLPGSAFFSMLFYLMLINLGMSTVTGIIETVPSTVYDFWPNTRKFKYLVNGGVFLSCFLLGMPITCRGGLGVYTSFDVYGAGLTLIPVCCIELTIIVFIYGIGRFCEDINFMLGFYPNRYYRYQWMIGPFFLLAVFLYGLIISDVPDQKWWSIALGWLLFIIIIGQIPVGMIYQIVTYKKKGLLKEILKPPPDHGPKDEDNRVARAEFSVKRVIF